MTALQIFAAIFIIALIAGWVIIADALRNAPYENTGDELPNIHDTHFD